MKGGYTMIDCTGLDLTKGSTEQTITGLYAKANEAHDLNKPIYVYNCTWGTQGTVSPIQIMIVEFDGYLIGTASTLQIIVTDEDVVTINNLID